MRNVGAIDQLICSAWMFDRLMVGGYDSSASEDTSESILSSATPSSEAGTSFNGIVEALTIDNLSTRSGPSTKYRETGTYKVKDEYVRLISLAYDENDICWVQCEVTYGNKLRRLYTGLKRFDISTFDLGSVPEEDPLDYRAKITSTSKAMYGPGDGYGTYDSLTVDKG